MTRTTTAILFIWAGLLIGVSFVAKPAKFLAPSLALAQALDVGRWTSTSSHGSNGGSSVWSRHCSVLLGDLATDTCSSSSSVQSSS